MKAMACYGYQRTLRTLLYDTPMLRFCECAALRMLWLLLGLFVNFIWKKIVLSYSYLFYRLSQCLLILASR